MAGSIFRDAQVVICCEDLSDHVSRVQLTRSYDMQDNTAMGATSHSRLTGLETWTATIEFLQDFAAGGSTNLDSILESLLGSGVSGTLRIRAYKAQTKNCSNPEWTGTVVLQSFDPLNGAVGDLLKTSVPLQSSGNLTRSVSCTS